MQTTLPDKGTKVKSRSGIDPHSHLGWKVAIASRRFYCDGPKTPIKSKAAPVASGWWLLRRVSDTTRFERQILGLWLFVQDLTLNLARLPIA